MIQEGTFESLLRKDPPSSIMSLVVIKSISRGLGTVQAWARFI